VDADNTVYMGSENSHMYAFNPDGTTKWAAPVPGAVMSNAEVAANGNLYFGYYIASSPQTGGFAALDKAGKLVWKVPLANSVKGSAVTDAAAVYIGGDDGKIHALNLLTGATIWATALCGGVYSTPALGSDGTIYVGAGSAGKPCSAATGYFAYAITPATGAIKWKFPTLGISTPFQHHFNTISTPF